MLADGLDRRLALVRSVAPVTVGPRKEAVAMPSSGAGAWLSTTVMESVEASAHVPRYSRPRAWEKASSRSISTRELAGGWSVARSKCNVYTSPSEHTASASSGSAAMKAAICGGRPQLPVRAGEVVTV